VNDQQDFRGLNFRGQDFSGLIFGFQEKQKPAASRESCGRPTPTPNHHPSPLLVPLTPERGQGERRGGYTMPSALRIRTLLTQFGLPTAADAPHFRSL
jgi:hypothetical protein